MTDDPIHRYLAQRADALDLAPGDPSTIARRATHRRHRRRAGVLGVAAAFAVGAVSIGVIDRDGDEGLQAASPGVVVVESPFDWTVVEPRVSLAYDEATAEAGGALYSLSTAPGAPGDDVATFDQPRTLYRSTDGTEWEAVDLPEGLWASALAGDSTSLYALGTAPGASGSEDLVLASADGGDGWSTATLDLGPRLEDLRARFPGQIDLSNLSVVAGPDGPVAAAAVHVRPYELVQAFAEQRYGAESWVDGRHTPDGVTFYSYPECEGAEARDTPMPTTTVTTAPEGAVADDLAIGELEAVVDACSVDESGGGDEPAELGTHTWEEIGVAPELVDLVGGQLVVVAPDDAGDLRASVVDAAGGTYGPQLVAVDGGLRLVANVSGSGDRPAHRVLRSPHGRAWSPDPAGDQPGYVMGAGALDGRLAVALDGLGVTGSGLRVEHGADWSDLDLAAALPDGADHHYGAASFGPLGLVVVAWSEDGQSHLVHTDGTALSAVALADLLGAGAGSEVTGLSVTADAITARVPNPRGDRDPDTPPSSRLVVGTPRA